MQLIKDPNELLTWEGCALVPTMGALHEGHLSLVHAAKHHWSGPIVVTIFVNPTQFEVADDLQNYPCTLERDLELLEPLGVSAVFAPSVDSIYPPDNPPWQPALPTVATAPQLEDRYRPNHFAGVTQIVAHLIDLCRPQRLLFGEKDYQQLCTIQEMVERETDRWPALQVEGCPTVREADGLAMSSRNQRLKGSERQQALGLVNALRAAQETDTPTEAEARMSQILREHDLQIDYAVVRDAKTLQPIREPLGSTRALIAAHLGCVRLIDNLATEFDSA